MKKLFLLLFPFIISSKNIFSMENELLATGKDYIFQKAKMSSEVLKLFECLRENSLEDPHAQEVITKLKQEISNASSSFWQVFGKY